MIFVGPLKTKSALEEGSARLEYECVAGAGEIGKKDCIGEGNLFIKIN